MAKERGSRFRRPVKAARPYVRQPTPPPATLEVAVEEGVLISRSTLVMEVKNHIILLTLRDDQPFDPAEAAGFVAHELIDLADEQSGYADRMERALGPGDRTLGNRELFLSLDTAGISRRATIFRALAAELTRMSTDDATVDELVEAARDRAWSEVAAVIDARLDGLVDYVPDENYLRERDERIGLFVALDLAALEPPPEKKPRRR